MRELPFEITGFLGEGVYGSVFQGIYKRKDVAIKFLREHRLPGSSFGDIRNALLPGREVGFLEKLAGVQGVPECIHFFPRIDLSLEYFHERNIDYFTSGTNVQFVSPFLMPFLAAEREAKLLWHRVSDRHCLGDFSEEFVGEVETVIRNCYNKGVFAASDTSVLDVHGKPMLIDWAMASEVQNPGYRRYLEEFLKDMWAVWREDHA
ncbi:hypothetical protein HZA98_02340 [Candidatus Woesearchaeota archaeon]|nr:hypothetical protein [Candidatus Woesearchaeota archaeon]